MTEILKTALLGFLMLQPAICDQHRAPSDFKEVIFPHVEFKNSTILESVELVVELAKNLGATDRGFRGLRCVDRDSLADGSFSASLEGLSFERVIAVVAKGTGMDYRWTNGQLVIAAGPDVSVRLSLNGANLEGLRIDAAEELTSESLSSHLRSAGVPVGDRDVRIIRNQAVVTCSPLDREQLNAQILLWSLQYKIGPPDEDKKGGDGGE